MVDDHFYGRADTRAAPPTLPSKKITEFEDLVIYRGHHICDSKTFKDKLPKLFTSQKEEEADFLLNLDILKIKKFQHCEMQHPFLLRFKEDIRRIAYSDYVKKMERMQKKEMDRNKAQAEKRIQAKKSKKGETAVAEKEAKKQPQMADAIAPANTASVVAGSQQYSSVSVRTLPQPDAAVAPESKPEVIQPKLEEQKKPIPPPANTFELELNRDGKILRNSVSTNDLFQNSLFAP